MFISHFLHGVKFSHHQYAMTFITRQYRTPIKPLSTFRNFLECWMFATSLVTYHNVKLIQEMGAAIHMNADTLWWQSVLSVMDYSRINHT